MWREVRGDDGWRGSGPEAAVPLTEGTQRPEEVDLAEVRPVGLAEVELAVRALPEQETAEPLLPGGADDQVRVGLALGVEVLGDLAAPAVADRHVDQHPVDVTGVVLGRLEPGRGAGGQQVERPDRVDAPAVRSSERVDGLLD